MKMALTALLALLLSGCAPSQTPSGSVSTVTVTATSSPVSGTNSGEAMPPPTETVPPSTPIETMPPTLTESTTPTADLGDRSSYRAVTERQFALMMKDPDAHMGERIIIAATVTQFDSLTGPDEFRADVRAQPGSEPVNALVGAPYNSSILNNVVKGDNLTMFVTMGGIRMYETQFGNQVVPRFTVHILETFNFNRWPGK